MVNRTYMTGKKPWQFSTVNICKVMDIVPMLNKDHVSSEYRMSLITPVCCRSRCQVFMMTGAGAEPPIGGEGLCFLCGRRAMVIWSTPMRSGSLFGRRALAFLGPRFVALCFNLGTGAPSLGVTGDDVRPLAEVEGRGAAYDVVSACPFRAGAVPAAWLSTSSRPWSLASFFRLQLAFMGQDEVHVLLFTGTHLIGVPGGRGKSLRISGNSRLRMASWSALYWMPSFVGYRSPCRLMKNLLTEALT